MSSFGIICLYAKIMSRILGPPEDYFHFGHVNKLYNTCTYKRHPEDEPSGRNMYQTS
jgi:hypothetical protein